MPELKIGDIVTVFVNDERPYDCAVQEIHGAGHFTPPLEPHPYTRVRLVRRDQFNIVEINLGSIRPPEPGKRNYWWLEYNGPLYPTET